MDIKILTTYDVYNYGASLQAYALLLYFSKLGHDARLIKYQPNYLSRKYDYWWVNPESKASKYLLTRMIYRIGKFIQRQTTMKRKHAFDQFNHNFLKETNITYHSYEELLKAPPTGDLFLCGSDQIWNVLYEAGRDPAFFLEFVPPHKKKVSYAASFSYLDIDNKNLERIQSSLKKFGAVSVREFHGINILKRIGIEGQWVLDPVFLIQKRDWRKFAEQGNIKNFNQTAKYLLIYDFERNNLIKESALLFAKKNHLKIYAVTDTYPLRYADKNFSGVGPIEFVKLIANSEAFFSNSFHGTVFSLIFHKPFFVFERHRHAVNSRMESLLTLFETKERLITSIHQFEDVHDQNPDWDNIESIKTQQLKISESFIKLALQSITY